jgi:hypothetical protein
MTQKILTLVNGVPRLVEEIFGAYYQDNESLTSQPTTSTTYASVLTFTTPAVTAGKYAVAFDVLYSFTSTTEEANYRILVDGIPVYTSSEKPTSSDTADSIPRSGFKKVNLTAATHTITLEHAISGGSNTLDTKECRLEFWRVE